MLATSAETLSAKLANNCLMTHHNKDENKWNKTEETETLIAVMNTELIKTEISVLRAV